MTSGGHDIHQAEHKPEGESPDGRGIELQRNDGITGDSLKDDTTQITDHEAERALCFKFDIRLLPTLATMYLFNALDRGNIGNAQTAGLSKDLHFKAGQYNLLISLFFIPYVVFAPPVAMIGKRFGPARVLPILMFTFGAFTLVSAAARDFGGLLALRCFLGVAESAFAPLVIYYLTTFYRRGELARRIALFYAASNIANAFSGLLAFGVFQIKTGILKDWRYLFLIEGACTVLFAVFAFWYLPQNPSEARFLNEAEKSLAFHRIQVDSSSIVSEEFNFRDAVEVFKHPTTYVILILETCVGVPIHSVTLFLPQIIQRLGHSTVITNLYTVAPNCTGAVVLLILAYSSDACRLRSPFLVLSFLLGFAGFMIYTAINDIKSQSKLAYYACFMMTWGSTAPSVLLSTWYNNNIANENRRIFLTSIGIPIANIMGLVSGNIFRERDMPKYQPALITTGAFEAAGALLATCLALYMAWDNRRRNKAQGVNLNARDIPTKHLRAGPDSPEFRWYL